MKTVQRYIYVPNENMFVTYINILTYTDMGLDEFIIIINAL